jgi:hypothetical protein
MPKRLVALMIVAACSLAPSVASAASNPSGTGQPNQECGGDAALLNPAGFDSGGFGIAEAHYAGSAPQNSNNAKSVSQYDVACFQYSQHH